MTFLSGLVFGIAITLGLLIFVNGGVFFADFQPLEKISKDFSNDTLVAAVELGRLDLVTVLLAGVALLAVFAAFPLYQVILKRCETMIEGRLEGISDQVEEVATKEVEKLLPNMIDSYHELIHNGDRADSPNEINDAMADSIARAQQEES